LPGAPYFSSLLIIVGIFVGIHDWQGLNGQPKGAAPAPVSQQTQG
jgi:hypothetical protein